MKCDPPMHVWSGNNSMGEVFLHPCQCGQLQPVAPALPERPAPPEEQDRLGKVRAYLIRISKKVTRPAKYGFQLVRRERDEGDIEYQIFADTEENGCQIAWVQSTRHDAEFIQACLAQAPLFAELLAALPSPAPPTTERED